MGSAALFPIRLRPNQILLTDMLRRERPQILTLKKGECTLSGATDGEEECWRRVWGLMADQRTTNSNLDNSVYCRAATSKVNFYLICNNLYQNRYKVVYGCDRHWQVSELGKSLINDKESQL